MKKLLAILLAPVLVLFAFAGCSGSEPPNTPGNNNNNQSGVTLSAQEYAQLVSKENLYYKYEDIISALEKKQVDYVVDLVFQKAESSGNNNSHNIQNSITLSDWEYQDLLSKAALYDKYKDIVDSFENQSFDKTVEVLLQLGESYRKQEEKTAIHACFAGTYYLGGTPNGVTDAPATLEITENGVKINGEEYSLLEKASGTEELQYWLYKCGEPKYRLRLVKYKSYAVPEIDLTYAEIRNGWTTATNTIGYYYDSQLYEGLLGSWRPFASKSASGVANITIKKESVSFEAPGTGSYPWEPVKNHDGTVTVKFNENATFTVEKRGDRYIGALDMGDGDVIYYYAYKFGYDFAWKEYVYVCAIDLLNECLEDVAAGNRVGFYDKTEEGNEYYYENDAWKRLCEIFTYLGDYKDSADYLSRFTVFESVYTRADKISVDSLDNRFEYEVEEQAYNGLGKVASGNSEELFRLYGGSSNLYFTYDETGKATTITDNSSWGDTILARITLTYDAAGKVIGGEYRTNDESYPMSYVYDAADRLIENTVWGSNGYRCQYTYTYDATGKLSEIAMWKGYDPDNGYKGWRETTTYTYDANGFVASKKVVQESYNEYNNTFTVDVTETYTYTCDASGRPISADYTWVHRIDGALNEKVTIVYTYSDLYFYN